MEQQKSRDETIVLKVKNLTKNMGKGLLLTTLILI